jgi:aspartate racemase
MGPAATVDLMAKVIALTPAARDQDHVPLVVWSIPQIAERVPAVEGRGPSPLAMMLEGVRALEAAQCSAFAIACNTAHHWAGELAAATRIPLLHIADAAVAAVLRQAVRPRRIALLGTRGTIRSGFYQMRLDEAKLPWSTAADTGAEATAGIEAAIDAVKRNRLAEARQAFAPAARRLLDSGCDLLLLACTELPMASAGSGLEAQCLDTNHALAEAIVNHSLAGRSPTAGAPVGRHLS